jgi:hypothetical protein
MLLDGLSKTIAVIGSWITLAVLLAVPNSSLELGSSLRSHALMAEHGTLVITIPTAHGLVVAADSRAAGKYFHVAQVGRPRVCDEFVKIQSLKNHLRTVFGMSGTQSLYKAAPPKAEVNFCDFMRNNASDSLAPEVQKYFKNNGSIIDEVRFRSFEKAFIERISKLWGIDGVRVSADPGNSIVTLMLGQYDVAEHESVVGVFRLCNKGNKPVECLYSWKEFHATDASQYQWIGEIDRWSEVTSEDMRHQLGSDYLKSYDYFLSHPRTIESITTSEALNLAVDIIRSMSKAQELRDGYSTLGGPVRAFLLDENHPMPFRLQ